MVKGKNGFSIPKVVIERIPRYYRYFDWLDGQLEKISSKKLGDLMGSSASQVRLDLSYFGDFGQQGYGYNIKKLKRELADILSISSIKTFIIIGAGNMGMSLTKYNMLKSSGFILKAMFDIKPVLIGKKVDDVLIHDAKDLVSFVKKNEIEIGIITVPEKDANDVAHTLIGCGIKGIINFAPLDLDVPDYFPVVNVHLIDKMLALSYITKNAV